MNVLLGLRYVSFNISFCYFLKWIRCFYNSYGGREAFVFTSSFFYFQRGTEANADLSYVYVGMPGCRQVPDS